MNKVRLFFLMMLTNIVCLELFSSTTPVTTTTDTALTGIATAAKAVGALRSDPQSRMFNYLKYHFSAAATRLSTVCNTTTRTFTGTASDAGVIIGLSNNTNTTFMIMQGNQIIGQVQPGWNSDVVLNLAALSDTTASPLFSFAFVPITGLQQSQLLVRVMTGQQLFTHIQNIEKRESGASTVTWYKNGTNPLPGAGDMAATSSDLYLVVENETLTSGTPLPAAAKRVQVLNLSNLTDLYTVSLAISNMGLALLNNSILSEKQLESLYAISIQSVHVLDEVQGHIVPLLVMPRTVFQAGSSVNSFYAKYVQAYALAVGKAYAGSAPVYYDLTMLYSHEPFEYLRLLKYFDVSSSVHAVIDKNAAMSSGQVVGSMILTDVYGAYVQDVSPDLSWVTCDASGFDTSVNDHVLFTFVDSSLPVTSSVSQAAIGDLQSSHAKPGFPITKISESIFNWSSGINTHAQVHSNINFPSGGAWYQSILAVNNPVNIVAGQSYNSVGSFPSTLWNLTVKDWSTYGIKLVPVFYDVNKTAPFTSLQDFNLVSSSAPSALYFYAYRGDGSNHFLGILPALSSDSAVATFPSATQYVYMKTYGSWNDASRSSDIWGFESTGYETFAQSKGTDVTSLWKNGTKSTITGFNNTGQWNLYYPGSMYWIATSAGWGSAGVFNKFSDMSTLNDIVRDVWTIKNNQQGAWTATVPVATTQAGVIVEIQSTGSNQYQFTLFDASNNIVGYQLVTVPAGITQFSISHMNQEGNKKSSSQSMTLPSGLGYFKLMDTVASGIVMVPKTPPQATSAQPVTPVTNQSVSSASTVISKVAPTLKVVPKSGVSTQLLQQKNTELKQQVKKLKNALNSCLNG